MLKEAVREFSEARQKLLILMFVFAAIFFFGSAAFAALKNISLSEGFVLTVETLAFFHELETGAVKALQILLLVFGVFFIWFTLWTSLELVMDGHFKKYFKEVSLMQSVKKLKNHYIICGGGRVGLHTAELLKARRIPFTIIEKQEHLIKEAVHNNFPIVEGDALEESMLEEAGLKRAKGLIAVLPETEKNILVILTAKEINPSAVIYARCNRKEHIKRLKKAGADHVFLPEFSCAEEISTKIE